MSNVETVLASIEQFDKQFFVNGLLYRGKLRKSMPSSAHPLLRYVHRMVTLYNGTNNSIPTTTIFYCQDYVDSVLGKDVLRVYLLKDGVEKIYEKLDDIALRFCYEFDKVKLDW